MLNNSKKTEGTVKTLELNLNKIKAKAERLAGQISEETLNDNSDWIVRKYGIDLYLQMKGMVS
jgi:hypothetical protein